MRAAIPSIQALAGKLAEKRTLRKGIRPKQVHFQLQPSKVTFSARWPPGRTHNLPLSFLV